MSRPVHYSTRNDSAGVALAIAILLFALVGMLIFQIFAAIDRSRNTHNDARTSRAEARIIDHPPGALAAGGPVVITNGKHPASGGINWQ